MPQLILAHQFQHEHDPKTVTYLVTVQEDHKVTIGIPHLQVSSLFEEFSFLLPDQLLATLSLRREIEHSIELLSREKPLAYAPYKMVPTQLKELHKQLEELLRVGHICSSHAPFDAPIIF